MLCERSKFAAFGGRYHAALACGVHQPLRAAPVRLQILLDALGSPTLEPGNLVVRLLGRVHIRLEGCVSGGQRLARRVDARAHHPPGLHKVLRAPGVDRRSGRIAGRRHAVRQIDAVLEAPLRDQSDGLAVVVSVHVDPTRNDGLSGAVNGSVGPRDVAFADAGDPSADCHDIAPLDHAGLVQGDDAGAREGDGSLWDVSGDGQAKVRGRTLAAGHVVGGVAGAAAELQRCPVTPAREESPLGRDAARRGGPRPYA